LENWSSTERLTFCPIEFAAALSNCYGYFMAPGAGQIISEFSDLELAMGARPGSEIRGVFHNHIPRTPCSAQHSKEGIFVNCRPVENRDSQNRLSFLPLTKFSEQLEYATISTSNISA